jgi:hypothetical protein
MCDMTRLRVTGALAALALAISVSPLACGNDDGGGSEAQRHGVGSACASDVDCWEEGQSCLTFKGGYCGVADCDPANVSAPLCPNGSKCVTHTDGRNYCFLVCLDKIDCNWNRMPEDESNCSSNITFADASKTVKACVPPS